MRTFLVMFVLVGWPVGVTIAQNPDESVLRSLERAQANAVVEMDFDVLEEIYADDFIFTHGTGEVHDKTRWFDALSSGRDYLSREHEMIEIELHGDLGIVYGVLLVHAKINGVEGQFRARYVRVYKQREGRWLLVSHRTVDQSKIS
ncbi:MAG: nuclear transport factor 2 family protein [Vicinamibacterales bacterium]|nr:nuclear transport factor 2 family protein [Vicinamibacterales bacterium]